eukprot:11344890-Alexandrium_andersonii.AAC.1
MLATTMHLRSSRPRQSLSKPSAGIPQTTVKIHHIRKRAVAPDHSNTRHAKARNCTVPPSMPEH